jgi:chemotaxis protein methyltransferase CheR
MILWQHFADYLKSWEVEIVATDLAEKVLDRARTGEYSQLEVNRGLPAQYLTSCFKKKGGRWHIIDPIRQLITFKQVNLLTPPLSFGPFDLVLCRNVLIYFEPDTKIRVLHGLTERMRPDGILMVGASEVLHGLTGRIRRVQKGRSTCYLRVD